MQSITVRFVNSGITEVWGDPGTFELTEPVRGLVSHGARETVIPGKPRFRCTLSRGEGFVSIECYADAIRRTLVCTVVLFTGPAPRIEIKCSPELTQHDNGWIEPFLRALSFYLLSIPMESIATGFPPSEKEKLLVKTLDDVIASIEAEPSEPGHTIP